MSIQYKERKDRQKRECGLDLLSQYNNITTVQKLESQLEGVNDDVKIGGSHMYVMEVHIHHIVYGRHSTRWTILYTLEIGKLVRNC